MIWALIAFSYLSGSVPYGVLVARSKGIDILNTGSGNIGTTNVIRVLGTKLGLFVFLLDVLKGTVPALAARFLIKDPMWGLDAQTLWFFVGFMSIVGHMVSPWLGFKGGKGIATGLGMALGAAPMPGLLAFAGFLVVAAVTRYISLASTIAIWLAPLIAWFWPGESKQTVPIYVLIALFVTWKHRKNYKRLLDGTEPKFSFNKNKPADAPQS